MSNIPRFFTLICLFSVACNAGFEKFAPPANSISGRGAKVNPKILTSTPSNNSAVSPITVGNGTQIKVTFDMSMKTDMTPVINTWVRDIGTNNDIIWYAVANSGATFTWSSTTYANDTVTIQLGWVRWPENNIIGFDFDNSTLVNLDDMPLLNENKISFTVGWTPGRYKVVQTGQESCYSYAVGGTPQNWQPRPNCIANGGSGDDPVGSQNFPAGQNGFIEPRNTNFGPTLYGASAGGNGPGRRFLAPENPMNMVPANCVAGNASEACYPYSVDPVTTLVWRTCSQGQYYKNAALSGDKCVPPSASDFTWGQAVNACAVLNTTNNGQGYGGRKDWRLPTIDELENLVDYGARTEIGQPEPANNAPDVPAIDGQKIDDYPYWEGAFPNTPTKGYWTATGLSARLNGQTYYGEAYVVEFKKGSMGAGGGSGSLLESNRKTSNRKKVRCVAGPSVAPPAQSYTASVQGAGQALATIGGTFSGYDADATFNIVSAKASYDIVNNKHGILITFNLDPHTTSGGTPANYHICPANAAADCGVIAPVVDSAIVTGKTVKITTSTAPGANTPYRLYINNVLDNATNALPLINRTVLFSGSPTTASPVGPGVTAFNITSATSPNTSTVRVVFDRLPDATQAAFPGNYKIVSGIPTVAATFASASVVPVTAVSLSGYTATLTAALTGGTAYSVVTQNITFAGAQVVDDNVNKLRWQKCRKGTFDNATCGDDGDGTNDSALWNDALNYCDSLNAIRYDQAAITSTSLRYAWRAPTINELKSLANRSLFGTIGVAIDTTIFPTPNVYAEDFASSTNYNFNGQFGYDPQDATPLQYPNFNQAWAFNYIAGFPSIAQKDNSQIIAGLKPPKKSIRCVRGLP
jgi:Protein of unknown function (DUF1566)